MRCVPEAFQERRYDVRGDKVGSVPRSPVRDERSAMNAALDRDFVRQCPRAYVVTDSCEERSTVVYARNPMEARRLGHYQEDVGAMDYEEELYVRRAPEFDDLRGKSLLRAQLDAGWWFECGYCQAHVSEDEVRYDPEDVEREFEIEPTIRGHYVYCSPWCAGADAAGYVDRRARKWESIRWAVECFPGCRVERVWVATVNRQGRFTPQVEITLPPDHGVLLEVRRDPEPLGYESTCPEWEAYHELIGRRPPDDALLLTRRKKHPC